MSRVTRRDAAAGGIAMLVLAASAAGAAKAEELDGELIALCHESGALQDKLNYISDELADLVHREAHPLFAREREYADRFCELRELIADLPAKTPEGVQAKAQIVLSEFRGDDEFEKYPAQYDPRAALALSLARDILGRSGT